MNAGFEGKIYRPGAVVSLDELGPGVVLECVGPVGPARKRPRPFEWRLWAYDFKWQEWDELARAEAVGWEWAEVLRPVALRALHPKGPELVDVLRRGRELADSVIQLIETKLEAEIPELRTNVWAALRDQCEGRLGSS